MNNGNYIILRDGSTCVLTTIKGEQLLVDIHDGKFTSVVDYKDYNYTLSRRYDIMKVYKDYTCSNLLWERKQPLLTKEEKDYLKAVIKPLTCPIEYIYKGCLAISIKLEGDDYIDLALYDNLKFKFKGLEEDKNYTLKELGLEE